MPNKNFNMKTFIYPLTLSLTLLLTSCKINNSKTTSPESTVTVYLNAKSGSSAVGEVRIQQINGVVYMNAKLEGLDPGTHAFHLHEKADCSSEDGKSSGGHWNPTAQPHGKWGSKEGYHRGDVGNFSADEAGRGNIEFSTSEWCLTCDDPNKNILGKAIIVHQGVDDYRTQPTGDAGGRVSCGGIIE